VAVGDYDNDGYEICSYWRSGGNKLYHNTAMELLPMINNQSGVGG